jgi:hypothetical protein
MGSMRHTTCFEPLMLSDVAIAEFLAEDPENFVIGYDTPSGLVFECDNLNWLKQQYSLPGAPPDRLPYKVFFECVPPLSDGFVPLRRLPGGRQFVKLGTTKLLTLKPAWIYEGPVPEPRIFLLEAVGSVNHFISNEFIPSLLPSTQQNAHGTDHCNQSQPTAVYRLVPVDTDLLFEPDTELVEEDEDDDEDDDDDDVVFLSTRRRTNPPPPGGSGIMGSSSSAILILGGGYANKIFGMRSL